ncbi:MAG: hypothetical protein HY902_01745 [Deltaproteobacteria bacterium]|nr:hypothetical protein [Deltaproteobacteria bacterium]
MDAPNGSPTGTSPNNTMKYLAIGCGALLLLGLLAGAVVTWYAAKKATEFAENPGYATLRLAVAANPDLETVSADAKAGTLTVLDKRTGKTTTLTMSSVKDGKLVIEADGAKVEMRGGDGGQGEMVVHGKNGEVMVARGGPGGGSVVVTGADGKVQVNAQGGPGGAVQVNAGGEQVKVEGGEGAGGNAVIQGPEGTAKLGNVQVPAWVPVYPGAAPAEGGGMVATTDEGVSGTVPYTTADPVAKVLETYAALLGKGGLPVKQKLQTGDGAMLMAATDDGKRTVTVMLGVDDGKTTIALAFSEKK